MTPFGLRFQWVAATLFWAFISILLCAQIWWIAQQPGESIAVRRTLIWQATFYLVWIPLTVAIWQAVARWRAEDRGRAVVIVTHLLACLLIGMVHTVVVVVIASVLAPSPTESIGVQMLVGQFRGRIYIQLVIYAGVVASGHAFAMYGRWREQTDRASRLEAQLAESRLSALRAQLHPHLLFNSLHAVASLVRESRNPEAVKLIADLGQLLRTVLDTHRVWHTVAEELALVRTFFDIQRVRFEDRLVTSVEVDPDANTALVPVLLIQPLVENSLRHGLAGKVGVGHVHVVVRHSQDRLTVQVDDDGVGGVNTLTSGDPGTGLANLRARLETLFGGEATLSAGPRDGGGFRVLIGMPHRRT